MQSSSNYSQKQIHAQTNRESLWIRSVLILGAIGLGFILWFGKQKRPLPQVQKKKIIAKAKKKKVINQVKQPIIRTLPTRTISAFSSKKSTKGFTSKKNAKKKSFNPAPFFYPLPFTLKLQRRQSFYQKKFAEAAKVKIKIFEKLFLDRLHKEQILEATTRHYRVMVVRIEAIRYMSYKGLKKYQKLGFQQLKKLEVILNRYLAEGGSIQQIPKGHSITASLAKKLFPFGGYYPVLLQNIGVTRPTRELSSSQIFWLRTLFMARWMRYTIGHYPLPTLMGKVLYEDYTKARVLFSKDPKRRLWAVRELSRIAPEIPTLRVLGWLFIQLQQPHFGIRSFRDALKKNPRDSLTQTMLRNILKSPL